MRTDTSIRERVIDLPATAAAAGLARRELAATPGLAGELGYKALHIRVTPERVRIEVGGPSPDISPDALLRSSETPSLGGMGLKIVDRMADAWGVQGEDDTSIWFELIR